VVILTELIEASDDATLEELCKLLPEKISFTISRDNGQNNTTLKHDLHKKMLFPSAKGSDKFQNLRV
jgi:hypothetical protein